jgi:cob(I)alamin adenosyltransferase
MSKFYTGRGDDGTTMLWRGRQRVPKYDLQPEAYGTVDEAQAALGLARALAQRPRTREMLLQAQRDLHVLMAELALAPEAEQRPEPFPAERVAGLEEFLAELAPEVARPEGFVVPGDSAAGAALDLARTVVRRAERVVTRLVHERHFASAQAVPYLNRLSSLLFVLARAEDAAGGSEDWTRTNAEERR